MEIKLSLDEYGCEELSCDEMSNNNGGSFGPEFWIMLALSEMEDFIEGLKDGWEYATNNS